ncbi:MAG: hypothetical protein GX087_08450 [Desulfobulbaceae bacterium]|nr:hypothetical protein [Desulfobulbaceae bacterium]
MYINFVNYYVRHLLLCCVIFSACLSLVHAEAAARETADDMIPLQVAAGTNLITLAREYCKNPEDWRTLARLNRLKPPYIIYAETEISVPKSLLDMEELELAAVTVSGAAQLRKHDGGLVELVQGGRIAPGETVVTGDDTFVQLLFPNGVYSRIEPNSAFTITYLFSLADKKIKAEAMLVKGKLTHTLDKKLRFNDSMRTRTPTVITGIRGTEYRLKTETDQSTRVETLAGEVFVQAGANIAYVRADQGIKTLEGKPLGAPQALPVAPAAPQLEPVYRTLPAKIQLPVTAEISKVTLRLSSDEKGLATVYAHSAPAGEALVVQNVPDGPYFAFFTVTDTRGFESREQGPQPFVVRTMPPAPMVTTPKNDSIMWGKTGQFTWLESEQAVRYRVQVSRDAGFTNIVDDQTLSSPSYTTAELTPGSYYFRVQALAADDFASNFSGILNWEQKEAPAVGGLESASDEPPQLQWHPMAEGWHYDLQVAMDKEFTELLVDERKMASTSYTLPDKLDPGKYYIHLRGIENGEPATPWTPAQTMTVKNRPKVLEGSLIGVLLMGILLL